VLKGIFCSRTDGGTILFMCEKCRIPIQQTRGGNDEGQLIYIFLCPVCKGVAGEWFTIEERDKELKEILTSTFNPMVKTAGA
jgi:hypothetical protein